MAMPKINVYLPDDLADAVKQANLPVSAICQRALEQAIRRVTALNEANSGTQAVEDALAAQIQQFNRFTNRTQEAIGRAVETARAENRAIGTGHLLTALVESEGLGVLVLRALEIDPRALVATVAARRSEGPAAGQNAGGFAPDALDALRLTVVESTALGQNYMGTEHLLLGLIAEQEGVGGHVLRAAGADLRLTRRAVSAALAGWLARDENASQPADMVTVLADAVREQLSPVLSRLDRLEQRLGE